MPRRGGGALCGTIVLSTSLTVFLAGAVASCNDTSNTTAAVQTPLVAAVTTPLVAAANDDAFRAATSCPDCTVTARSTVTLPLTGKTFVDAKLISAAGSPHAAAVDLGGNAVDSGSLLAAEGAAKIARQGKLRDVVYARSLTSSSDLIPVSIWADFSDGHEPRERMASDSSFRAAYQAQTASRLHAVTAKVTAWLDARGFPIYDRGTDTPLITTDVPASALTELGRLDGIAVVDFRYPEVPNGLTWFDAIKGTAAQMILGSVGGISFCNGEGTQPYDQSYLNVAQILDTGSLVSSHMQWTSELISATATPSTAPGESLYVPAYDHGSGGSDNYTFYQAWSWCFGLPVKNMNRSASYETAGPIPLAPDDMAEDYYVYHYPYPFITLSAGNCANDYYVGVDCFTGSPVDNGYVENHSHNALVIGASDTNYTSDTSDDTIAFFSPFGNPATTHNDFELPNLVAPGSEDGYEGVTSASGLDESGTSASAPMVMGTGLMMKQEDPNLGLWPEMMRAVILTASTHPVDGARTTALGGSDLRQGAGLLNSFWAVALASPYYLVSGPNNSATPSGRYASTYTFSSDFPGGVSAPFNIVAESSGRLRVVIAWDATATGCSAFDGSGCLSDAIDADLDLHVSQYINGNWYFVCNSSSYDSSWELCDVPVNAGEVYKAVVTKYTTNSTSTYLGIAWNNYDPNGE